MVYLAVPGAKLYYQTAGSGPLIVLIPGATGSVEAFVPLAGQLQEHATVATYDRRGFSRSRLDDQPDDEHRLAIDADDVGHLIEHLGGEPATVFGASSGAIVALEVLTRLPTLVRSVVPFEPPAVRLLEDGARWLDFFADVYQHSRRAGAKPALRRFRAQTFANSDQQFMAEIQKRASSPDEQIRVRDNVVHWFEHELRQYPAVQLDLDKLRRDRDKVLPVVGRDSRGFPCYQATIALGAALGCGVTELPGGHVGYARRPEQFSAELRKLIRERARPTS